MKLKLLKDLTENIHRDNPDDPFNPEVSVEGGGVRELKQLEILVKNRIAAINEVASRAKTAAEWGQIQSGLNNAATEAQITAIISAKSELEERDGTRDEMSDVPDKMRDM